MLISAAPCFSKLARTRPAFASSKIHPLAFFATWRFNLFSSLPHALEGDEAGEDTEGAACAIQHGFAGAVHPVEPLVFEGELAWKQHHEKEQREANDGWKGFGIVVGLQEF